MTSLIIQILQIYNLKNIDWKSTLQLRENDPSTSFDIFITTIKNVIAKHAPLKKLSTKAMDNLRYINFH